MRMMLVLVLGISVQAGMCVYEYLPTSVTSLAKRLALL